MVRPHVIVRRKATAWSCNHARQRDATTHDGVVRRQERGHAATQDSAGSCDHTASQAQLGVTEPLHRAGAERRRRSRRRPPQGSLAALAWVNQLQMVASPVSTPLPFGISPVIQISYPLLSPPPDLSRPP